MEINNNADIVLVIEDDAATLRLITEHLYQWGIRALVALDGESGLTRALQGQPDLILLDVLLPGMNGFEVCRRLKADEATQRIPVIFLTALDELEHKLKGFQVGAVDYITKPIQEEEMMARINTHLRLRELNERLEDQVHQRTDELSAAVAQAEQLNQRLEQEIVEHKRAEAQRDATLKALRESQARFHSIYEQAAVGIGLVSIEGLWLQVNPMICNITGYIAEELVGHSFTDITHPDDVTADLVVAGRLIKGQIERIYDVKRYLHKDGSIAWVNLFATLVHDAEDQPLYLIIVVSDITEQVRIGAEREALIAELEAKNKELERFTYTVSHDLKSPLVTVKGFLSFLKQDVQADDSQKVLADIASISSAVAKMQQLLDELLELSRIGRVIKQPEMALLGKLAQEALDTVAGRVAERGVEVHVAPGLLRPDGPTIYGDRLRLREVLENLLDNAVKYMGDQPRPRVEIGVRQDGQDMVFYVQDNGIGIEARYHQRIFDLFDKLNPESEGVGVGLSVVKRIVEVHGGRVWVESAGAGQGSTFCFTLPRDQNGGDQGTIRRTR